MELEKYKGNWAAFKRLPYGSQELVFQELIGETYNCTGSDVSRFFGVCYNTIYNYVNNLFGETPFKKGKTKTLEQQEAFSKLMSSEDALEDGDSLPVVDSELQNTGDEAGTPSMEMSKIEMSLAGTFDAVSLYNALKKLVPAGKNVDIQISISVKDDSV